MLMKKTLAALFWAIFLIAGPAYPAELRVSLAQAMEMAFMNNPELKSQRLDLEIAKINISSAMAAYDPYVSASSNFSTSNRPTSTPVFGNESKSASLNLSTGVATPSGGNASLTWSNSRTESNSSFMTLNPSYGSDLNLNFSQPLLKNGMNWRTDELKKKNNDYQRAEINLKSKAMEIASRVEDAYWSLVKARLSHEISKRSMERAQAQYDMTKSQVRAGIAAEVTLLQSQANLESSRVEVIRSGGELSRAENNLKQLLYFESEEELVQTRIIPSDQPQVKEQKLDTKDFIDKALTTNYVLEGLHLNLENMKIDTRQQKRQTLPQFDFSAGASLSGLAGRSDQSPQIIPTGFVVPNPLPGPEPYMLEFTTYVSPKSAQEGNYWDALHSLTEGNNFSWNAGLNFRVPLGNRQALNSYRISQYNFEKAELEISRQRRSIRFNLESLLTDLDTAFKSLQTARTARDLAEKSYEIEKKKYKLGMSTQYELLNQEQQVRDAERSLAGTVIDYNKALGRVKRAEQGYLESGGISGLSLTGLSIPSSISGLGSLSGLSGLNLSSISSMLPSGVDLNMLKSMGINLP